MDKINRAFTSPNYQPQYTSTLSKEDSASRFSGLLLAQNHNNPPRGDFRNGCGSRENPCTVPLTPAQAEEACAFGVGALCAIGLTRIIPAPKSWGEAATRGGGSAGVCFAVSSEICKGVEERRKRSDAQEKE